MAHPDIFKMVALLDVPEGFIAFPSGEVYLNDSPDGLTVLQMNRAACQKHHRLLAEYFRYHEKVCTKHQPALHITQSPVPCSLIAPFPKTL